VNITIWALLSAVFFIGFNIGRLSVLGSGYHKKQKRIDGRLPGGGYQPIDDLGEPASPPRGGSGEVKAS
jgi:hypothetical protein